MLRVVLVLGIVLSALAGSTACAVEGGCDAAAAAFVQRHADVIHQADDPPIACIPNDGDDRQAIWAFGTIYVETQPADQNYAVWIAHELGHAWAAAHNLIPTTTYGDVRGFSRPSFTGLEVIEYAHTLREDYAETFAWALGEWRPMVGVVVPPPYAFQNAAGVPTPEQVTALVTAGLLPGGPKTSAIDLVGWPSCPASRSNTSS